MDTEPPSLFITLASTLDVSMIIGLLGVVLLLIFSAIISGAEVALFSLSHADIQKLSESDQKKANLISKLLDRPKKLLATILVVNNFINIAIVIVFSFIKESLFGSIQTEWLRWLIEVGVVTFLILFFGEVLPKIYANRNSIAFAAFVSKPLDILNKLLTPINMPMRAITIYIEQRLSKQKSNLSVGHLSQALEMTNAEDTSHEEQKILEGIVSFGNTSASQVMSPRIDLFSIEITTPFKDVIASILGKGYSRIPVYRDTIDQIEGVLFVKDLLPFLDKNNFDWVTLLRQPIFVPENKKLDDLLKEFQHTKNHLAIVVDEYGGTSGIVTLEDIIEEIVGDISDEFDDENINYSKLDDHTYVFEGKITLKDFYRIVEVEEEFFEKHKGEAETLAGFLLELVGSFPKKAQKINFHNCTFTIESVDQKRIKQIKVTLDV